MNPSKAISVLDKLSAALVIILLVGGPWAFGSTTSDVIRIGNWIAYSLGIILVAKMVFRRGSGIKYSPWSGSDRRSAGAGPVFTLCILVLMVGMLCYAGISAWNARMSVEYVDGFRGMAYHSIRDWLPHSYDRDATWWAFRIYSGYFCVFWAVVDWLKDARGSVAGQREGGRRIKLLLWILVVNGCLVSLEGILQRLAGSPKLLFLIEPHINKSPSFHFGPFAYRSNGAQYLNLLWPCALGFWWYLKGEQQRENPSGRLGGGSHLIVPLCMLVMVSGVIVSVSRGGLIVAAMQLVACGIIFKCVVARKFRGDWVRISCVTILITGAAVLLVKDQLKSRLVWDPSLGGRDIIYKHSWQILEDHPLFGVGPGAFATVYENYLLTADEQWHAYLHNDWLQTLVEWGWIGGGVVIAGVLILSAAGAINKHGEIPGPFVALTSVGLGGCLLHAVVDFPLQIHSITMLFAILCAMVFTLGGRKCIMSHSNS